jgi:hypothetical protein
LEALWPAGFLRTSSTTPPSRRRRPCGRGGSPRWEGVWRASAPSTGRFSGPFSTHSKLRRAYLLESEDGHLSRLDRNFRTIGKVDVLESSQGREHAIGALYAWTPLGKGDRILAFADIHNADGGWQSGFVRVPLNDPSKFEILRFDVAHRSGAELLPSRESICCCDRRARIFGSPQLAVGSLMALTY